MQVWHDNLGCNVRYSQIRTSAGRRTRPCNTACGRAAPCRRYWRCSRARPWPLSERPDLIPCTAPGDPALARNLVGAAGGHPKTTWCVTVTDEQGHAIGHGCARPEPEDNRKHRGKPGPPDGHDPPGGTGNRDGPGFAFTATGHPGPPGGYGTWKLSTGTPGHADLMVVLDPIDSEDCPGPPRDLHRTSLSAARRHLRFRT